MWQNPNLEPRTYSSPVSSRCRWTKTVNSSNQEQELVQQQARVVVVVG